MVRNELEERAKRVSTAPTSRSRSRSRGCMLQIASCGLNNVEMAYEQVCKNNIRRSGLDASVAGIVISEARVSYSIVSGSIVYRIAAS